MHFAWWCVFDIYLHLFIQEAIVANQFFSIARCIESGDVDSALSSSDHVIEGQMHVGGQEHYYMEDILPIPIQQTRTTKLAPYFPAVLVVECCSGINSLLPALVTCGSINLVIHLVGAPLC